MTQCRLCDFWRPSNALQDNCGYCRCHAPSPEPRTWYDLLFNLVKTSQVLADNSMQWPVTHANDACGEGVEKAKK